MAIKFSLMIPTRKRPKQLELLVESIFATTRNPNDIEIHFGADRDDIQTQDTIALLQNKYSCSPLYPRIRGRGNSLVSHYINWLSTFCKGKYIITLNDDSLFKSKDWDVHVWNRLEKELNDKPDGIILGVCKDVGHPERVGYKATGFPMISRKGVDALGFFLDPCFMDATADDDICKLYATLGRAVDLQDILIVEHHPKELENLDSNYQTLQDNTPYDFFMPHPELPNTVADMRHFFDGRILTLLTHILKERK